MRKPASMKGLEELGRIRLSENFFLRDFLHSEIAAFYGLRNIPDDPDLAIAAGRRLCEDLLEPLQATFGRLAIRSAYRSPQVNAFGNEHGLNCASNEASAAGHIWDMRDAEGCMGATACVVVPWVADRFREEGDWRRLAWWITITCPMRASNSSRNSGRSTSLGTSAPGASSRASPPRAASSRDRAWQTTKAAMRRTMRAFRRPPPPARPRPPDRHRRRAGQMVLSKSGPVKERSRQRAGMRTRVRGSICPWHANLSAGALKAASQGSLRIAPLSAPFGRFCPQVGPSGGKTTAVRLSSPAPHPGPETRPPADGQRAMRPGSRRPRIHAEVNPALEWDGPAGGRPSARPDPPPSPEGDPLTDPEPGALRPSPKPRTGPASPARLPVYPLRDEGSVGRDSGEGEMGDFLGGGGAEINGRNGY